MSDDDYGDEEGGGGGSGSHEVGFFDDTEGVLIAGRKGDQNPMKRSELGKFKLAVEALGKSKGLELAVVPCGDLTDTGPGPDDDCWGSLVVGIFHGSGGTYGPEQVTREQALAKLDAAKKIGDDVWQAIAALMPEGGREGFLENEIALHLVPVGPLAYAMVIFGSEGTEENSGEGEYFRGADMTQEPHSSGVWGQKVASGEDPEVIDLSESAHQARVAAFPKGGYFLIAQYD
jgi:hypothetical protein